MKSIWFILREILHEGLGPLKARTQRRRDFLNDTSWERACLANDYGAAELRKNQNWYSWTALGLASVLFLNAVFIPVWTGMLNVEVDSNILACPPIPDCPMCSEYTFVPAPYGPKLEFGKKRITEFIIPEPAPLEEIFQDGTRNDQLLRSREKLEVKGDFWLDVDSTEAVPNIIVDVEPSITYSTFGVDKEPTPINLKEISQKSPALCI